ncbi:MAG: hypothetical protein JW725_04625 [Candidatus Babeliaceae bacterium]|nr:hypothetical protein [Candidatus Babeliaceae bacterium]
MMQQRIFTPAKIAGSLMWFLPLFLIVGLCATEQLSATPAQGHWSVVLKPVVDVFYRPLDPVWLEHQIPLSCLNSFDCPRSTQLLYNQVVFVEYEINDPETDQPWCWIAMPDRFTTIDEKSAYYNWSDQSWNIYFNHRWARSEDLTPVSEISENGVIPAPLSFADKASFENPNVITLVYPWSCHYLGLTFSAGTRFVRAPLHDTYHSYAVLTPESATILMVPRSIAHVPALFSRQERIELFTQLLRSWAHLPEGSIPFVWGGRSFIGAVINQDIWLEKIRGEIKGEIKNIGCWHHSDESWDVHTGIDAHGISLLAQICGIPVCACCSEGIPNNLRPLIPGELIENGDYIRIIGGGLFAVTDVTNGMVVGACGYQPGYGTFFEFQISERFVDAYSMDDLLALHVDQLPVTLKTKDGRFKEFERLIIYKISSAW